MAALIIVAAGSGQRLGFGIPKALVEVAGDTLLGHCLSTARGIPQIQQTVVVAPAADCDAIQDAYPDVSVVAGGEVRDQSVRNGLAAVVAQAGPVLIHDAARPFTPLAVFDRVLWALAAGSAAVIPGLPVVDTIKQVQDGLVIRTLDRSELMAVQTPQGFSLEVLRAAHAARTGEVTDDAMLVEQAGVDVTVVAGAPEAFKITTPFDMAVARALREE